MAEQTETMPIRCSTAEMIKYSLGGCTESLVMNSFFGFAMFYYTKALGLSAGYAGAAGAIATFWDAVTDPVMGHISDNTQNRFGKRYPYMLWGGLSMAACFFFIWYVPAPFRSNLTILFWYLVGMNLLLRTTYTIFIVPYTALGFEICDDYTGRSKLQGVRFGLNMAANLFGCAMAWTLFFGHDTETSRAANVAQNYVNMGTTFTMASAFFLLLMLGFTKKYIRDSRTETLPGNSLGAFFRDIKDIILDRYPRWVFLFMFFVLLGIVLVSFLQMNVFEDFMKFSGWQKTVAHGGTMVGCGIGSLLGAVLVRRFDKKGAVYIGVGWSVFCELMLAVLFLTGFLKPGQMLGGFPLAFVLFTFFHGAYWFGNGLMMPISLSMMADVAEIHEIQTEVNKSGSYAAMYSLTVKISTSVGLLISGLCLDWVGFVSGPEVTQTPQVIWRICALTLMVGPLASLAALGLISRYPVNKQFIENLRNQYGHVQD